MGIYHFKVGFPANFKAPENPITLTYSQHAIKESKGDRFGAMQLPATIDPKGCQVIEIETDARGKLLKWVFRLPLDSERDLVLAVMKGGFVKTVWINLKSDAHRTLNPYNYDRP